MWRTIGRLIWVPLAALISLLVSAFVVVTLGLERFMQERGAVESEFDSEFLDRAMAWLSQGELLFTTFQGLSIIGPVLLVIIGEVAKLRSSLYYVVGGGLTAVAGPILTKVVVSGGDITLPGNTFLSVLATAGFAGGFIYWVLAGRNA